jgi:DNA-binding CsgD family transcriptional regulator
VGPLEIASIELNLIEQRILNGLANGLQSKELAILLDRRVPTIEMYIRRLYVKMSARSRAHLVALAFCAKLLDDSEIVFTQNRSPEITADCA